MNEDPYESFKRGIKRDAIGSALGLIGGLTAFFFILFLFMIFWCVVMSKSGWSAEARIIGTIFLCIVVPCLFFTRTSNFILSVWGLIVLLVVSAIVLVVGGYFIYMCFAIAFELV